MTLRMSALEEAGLVAVEEGTPQERRKKQQEKTMSQRK
jgi:hypothetical protein